MPLYFNQAEVNNSQKSCECTFPTKVSELENDKNYISEIPQEYVTEKKLANSLLDYASMTSYEAVLGRLVSVETKVSELEKTNTEIVVPEASSEISLKDSTKDYIISGEISKPALIEGKSVTLKDTKVENATVKMNANSEIAIRSLDLTGAYPENAGKVVTIDNGETIVIRDSEFNASSAYNMVEIGLQGNILPKNILIENCRFTGKYKNNAILIFGTQDNAVININNCYFEDVSNAVRLSNKSNAKNITVNITNCTCDKWDADNVWAGLLICQDYTSGSVEAEETNNLFAPEKIILNISNLVMPEGKRLSANTNPADICGTLDAKTQVIYVWNGKGGSIPYSEIRYPKIKIS